MQSKNWSGCSTSLKYSSVHNRHIPKTQTHPYYSYTLRFISTNIQNVSFCVCFCFFYKDAHDIYSAIYFLQNDMHSDKLNTPIGLKYTWIMIIINFILYNKYTSQNNYNLVLWYEVKYIIWFVSCSANIIIFKRQFKTVYNMT